MPSSVTSTTSARPGPRWTNSICFSGRSCFGTTTTPAQCDRPESAEVASSSACARLLPRAAHSASILCRSVLGQVAKLEQPVHEQAQPRLGRQPPGRGVRRVEQPRLFEIGHHVADRRRRQVLAQQPRQRARADRLAGLHIAVDDQAKNLAAALVQLGERRRRRRLVAPLTAFHVLATAGIRTAAAIGRFVHPTVRPPSASVEI